ncbi:phosphodiesterase [Mycobacterium persicum]|uniref:Phosphodiesterase n=1 Tax=Mycobacterium persicum TaxID=1487726 RepID=A0A1X0LDM6_9MYCO|nr:phosphodiesterase [Mycobacterium persicum]KZS85459.1 phosphodiesterase [Mycobacterium persicum]ORB48984.1 phosphodiesterase [Mycobacterium persicum]ORB91565.1 phosphodiesterase [Mycobacterium persicum]ORB96932.1 phosphodiesterase [Mycobacterium persicum]ORC03607.1 phosphodiesterase [Mycobacterium persicum]
MTVSDFVARPFQWGSAIRGSRIFHPVGVIASGSIERVAPASTGLPVPSSDVVVRVSKAGGTPGSLPDFIGLALRVAPPRVDATPWDILLVSAGSGVLSRALALRPVTSWTGPPMTTLMPLRYRAKYWWLRARILTDINGFGLSLGDVRERINDGGVELALDQACGRANFEKVAHLRLTSVASPGPGNDVSFDPVVNTVPGLRLFPGWLADLRGRAYARSRDGRHAGAAAGGCRCHGG